MHYLYSLYYMFLYLLVFPTYHLHVLNSGNKECSVVSPNSKREFHNRNICTFIFLSYSVLPSLSWFVLGSAEVLVTSILSETTIQDCLSNFVNDVGSSWVLSP
jgi:hypothetical protein